MSGQRVEAHRMSPQPTVITGRFTCVDRPFRVVLMPLPNLYPIQCSNAEVMGEHQLFYVCMASINKTDVYVMHLDRVVH